MGDGDILAEFLVKPDRKKSGRPIIDAPEGIEDGVTSGVEEGVAEADVFVGGAAIEAAGFAGGEDDEAAGEFDVAVDFGGGEALVLGIEAAAIADSEGTGGIGGVGVVSGEDEGGVEGVAAVEAAMTGEMDDRTGAELGAGGGFLEGGFVGGGVFEDVGGVEVAADQVDFDIGVVEVLGGVLDGEEGGGGLGAGAVLEVGEDLATGGIAYSLGKIIL